MKGLLRTLGLFAGAIAAGIAFLLAMIGAYAATGSEVLGALLPAAAIASAALISYVRNRRKLGAEFSVRQSAAELRAIARGTVTGVAKLAIKLAIVVGVLFLTSVAIDHGRTWWSERQFREGLWKAWQESHCRVTRIERGMFGKTCKRCKADGSEQDFAADATLFRDEFGALGGPEAVRRGVEICE